LGETFSSYGALKTAVSEAVVEVLEPIQQRYQALRADERALAGVLAVGAERASRQADPVVQRARAAIGLVTT
jgi:tryptophanyl-tRNA synthetase